MQSLLSSLGDVLYIRRYNHYAVTVITKTLAFMAEHHPLGKIVLAGLCKIFNIHSWDSFQSNSVPLGFSVAPSLKGEDQDRAKLLSFPQVTLHASEKAQYLAFFLELERQQKKGGKSPFYYYYYLY